MYVTNRRENLANDKMTIEPDSTIPLRVSYPSHVVSSEGSLSTVSCEARRTRRLFEQYGTGRHPSIVYESLVLPVRIHALDGTSSVRNHSICEPSRGRKANSRLGLRVCATHKLDLLRDLVLGPFYPLQSEFAGFDKTRNGSFQACEQRHLRYQLYRSGDHPVEVDEAYDVELIVDQHIVGTEVPVGQVVGFSLTALKHRYQLWWCDYLDTTWPAFRCSHYCGSEWTKTTPKPPAEFPS